MYDQIRHGVPTKQATGTVAVTAENTAHEPEDEMREPEQEDDRNSIEEQDMQKTLAAHGMLDDEVVYSFQLHG